MLSNSDHRLLSISIPYGWNRRLWICPLHISWLWNLSPNLGEMWLCPLTVAAISTFILNRKISSKAIWVGGLVLRWPHESWWSAFRITWVSKTGRKKNYYMMCGPLMPFGNLQSSVVIISPPWPGNSASNLQEPVIRSIQVWTNWMILTKENFQPRAMNWMGFSYFTHNSTLIK